MRASAVVTLALSALALQASALVAPAPAPAVATALPMAAATLQTGSPDAPKAASVEPTVTSTHSMQGRGPANCIGKAQGIVGSSSSCKPVIDYLKPYGDSMAGADDGSVRKLVSGMPPIDSDCCWTLRDFIDNACMCNDRLVGLLPMIRLSQNVLKTATRAIQASTCASANYGGALYDPCTGTSGPAGGTGSSRRLLLSDAA